MIGNHALESLQVWLDRAMRVTLAQDPADAAPKDGRVYRGYFERSDPRAAMVKAVSWDETQGWVDLAGNSVGDSWRLSAWSPD